MQGSVKLFHGVQSRVLQRFQLARVQAAAAVPRALAIAHDAADLLCKFPVDPAGGQKLRRIVRRQAAFRYAALVRQESRQ